MSDYEWLMAHHHRCRQQQSEVEMNYAWYQVLSRKTGDWKLLGRPWSGSAVAPLCAWRKRH